jgi:hypothetical protein
MNITTEKNDRGMWEIKIDGEPKWITDSEFSAKMWRIFFKMHENKINDDFSNLDFNAIENFEEWKNLKNLCYGKNQITVSRNSLKTRP